MRGTADGGRRLPGVRMIGSLADAWRERRSEQRAVAAPKVVPEGRLSRSRIAAAVQARLAVRSGVRLDDYLRSRLAKYAARLPVPLEDLPIAVDIEGGEAVFRGKAPARAPARPPSGADPLLAKVLVEREGPYAAREIRDAEAALDALDARAEAARIRIDGISRSVNDALASGALAARPDIEATPEQLGRPPVPPVAPIGLLRGFVAALLVAEAWRFSDPILAASGVAPDGLEAALHGAPLETGLALVLAVGAAATVFAFAGVTVSRAADALDETAAPRRNGLALALALGAALLAAGVAAAASDPGRAAQLALLAAVPFAGALLWRTASGLARVRAGALDAALSWDRERAREAVEHGRHAAVLAAARAELAGIEAEREVARRRVRALHRRAVDAERQAGIAARAEARRLDRLAEALASALELDRYLFIRLAAERTQQVAPRPVRPSRLEAAVATDRLGMAG
jgi:hypothetical protein